MSSHPQPGKAPTPIMAFEQRLVAEAAQELGLRLSFQKQLAADFSGRGLTRAALVETHVELEKRVPFGQQFGYETVRDAKRWLGFRVAVMLEHGETDARDQVADLKGLLEAGDKFAYPLAAGLAKEFIPKRLAETTQFLTTEEFASIEMTRAFFQLMNTYDTGIDKIKQLEPGATLPVDGYTLPIPETKTLHTVVREGDRTGIAYHTEMAVADEDGERAHVVAEHSMKQDSEGVKTSEEISRGLRLVAFLGNINALQGHRFSSERPQIPPQERDAA